MAKKFISAKGMEYPMDENGYIIYGDKKYLAAELEKAGKGTVAEEPSGRQGKETVGARQAAQKKETESSGESERGFAEAAKDIAAAIANSPGVIKRGLELNAPRVAAKTVAGAFIPNTYSAIKEKRYLGGIPVGLSLDAAQLALSPLKALGAAAKALGVSRKIINPVSKTPYIGKNIGRNAPRQALVGMGDNLAYEAASDAIDSRERDAKDYLASGIIGGISGLGASALYSKEQAKKIKEYETWLKPTSYKQEVKESIRNAQNDIGSDLETFSEIVNSGRPFTTTAGHLDIAKKNRKAVGEKMEAYKASPEAHAPAQKATLSDFQEILRKSLYDDNSGNLSRTEKDQALMSFYDDATDMLISNSPKLKRYMEENSKKVLGHPMAYLDNQDFISLALERYNLSPNEMNLLRRAFSNKTTLAIPSKPGYVRAGKDNRSSNEYAEMFKREIDSRPETSLISRYNKEWSAAKNREEIVGRVLDMQGRGGILNYHFPYIDMNPEANPTIIRNFPLKARNVANTVLNGIPEYMGIPEETRSEAKAEIVAAIEDARKLGLKTEKEITDFVYSRLEGKQPTGEVFATSSQKKGER